MKIPKVNVKPVLAQARKQIEGLREQPEIARGLAFQADALEATLQRLLELDARQERAKKILVRLTERIMETAFELRDQVTRNIGIAQGRYGKYGAELAALGGKPLSGTHRPPKQKVTETPSGPVVEAA